MAGRTRIINDPSYLVPLLRTFGSRTHKKVFDLLLTDWMTEEELDAAVGSETHNSLINLKKAGLLESKWRIPEEGRDPVKEFRTSYTDVQVNFHCTFEDLSDIIMLAFKPYEEVKDTIENLQKLVAEGNTSMSKLTRELNMNSSHICSIARRSDTISVMGQRLKLITKDEEL
ncbi:ArsR family transcriptional regulator [Methanosarcinaceae archaeon]|nr:ArsR family transcriptional regulator [Methanosarcinaceae archaeon]MBQ3620707.1 ArsR family transcriptional regulator [Methanosarcinaceae archaeon]